jgi:hypothetical protein
VKEALSSPKRRFLQEIHGVTSQKTPFFIVTAVKTLNLIQYSYLAGRLPAVCRAENHLEKVKDIIATSQEQIYAKNETDPKELRPASLEANSEEIVAIRELLEVPDR